MSIEEVAESEGATSASWNSGRVFDVQLRDAAAALLEFSERHTANSLAAICLETSADVQHAVEQIDVNARSVVEMLRNENSALRSALLQVVKDSSEAVADALASASRLKPQATSDDDMEGTTENALLATERFDHHAHDAALNHLSKLVEDLTTENVELRCRLAQVEGSSVPQDDYNALKSAMFDLESELQRYCTQADESLIQLEERAALDIGVSKAEGTACTSELVRDETLPPQVSIVHHDALWNAAIREVEEKAIWTSNQRKDMARVQEIEEENVKLQSRAETLQADLENSKKTIETLTADYEVLSKQNEALMGQFISLLETSQQLATQYQVAADGRSSLSSAPPGADTPPQQPVDGRRVLDIPWSTGRSAIKSVRSRDPNSYLLDAAAATASAIINVTANSTAGFGGAKASYSTRLHPNDNTYTPDSPAAQSSTYRKFSIAEVREAASKYSLHSIEDLARRNQELLRDKFVLQEELSTLHSKLSRLELQLPVRDARRESPLHSAAPHHKRIRSEQTTDAAHTSYSVDAATETCALQELHEVRPGHYPVTSESNSPSAAVVAPPPKDSVIDWSLLTQLSEMHEQFAVQCHAKLGYITGRHAQQTVDALIHATVQYGMRALEAERECQLAKAAYDVALEDIAVRDALNSQQLENLQALLTLALADSKPDGATSRESDELPLSRPSDDRDVRSLVALLRSAAAKETMLQELIRQTPARAQFAASAALPSEAECKLREQEAVSNELQTQLSIERERSARHLQSLHSEKVRHMNTMERMWQAEQSADEARSALLAMQASNERMYTTDQMRAVEAAFEECRQQLVDVSNELERQRATVVEAQHSSARELADMQNTVDRMASNSARLEEELRDERAALAVNQRKLQDTQHMLCVANADAVSLRQTADETQHALQFHVNLVEELKQVLLSQSCTEQLLMSLYPGDSALATLMARDRYLADENITLKKQLTDADAQCVLFSQSINELTATIQLLRDEKKLLEVERHVLSSSATQQAASHKELVLAHELHAATHRVAELTTRCEQLALREKMLEERVESLASDPISLNVRKYGVQRANTLEEQIAELHEQRNEVSKNLAVTEELHAGALKEIEGLKTACAAQDEKLIEMAQLLESQSSVSARQASRIEELSTQAVELQAAVANKRKELTELETKLTSCQREVGDLNTRVLHAHNAERMAKEDSSKLMQDNLTLIAQLNELTEALTRVESEHRATKAALATQTAALASALKAQAASARFSREAQSTSASRKNAISFRDAAARSAALGS